MVIKCAASQIWLTKSLRLTASIVRDVMGLKEIGSKLQALYESNPPSTFLWCAAVISAGLCQAEPGVEGILHLQEADVRRL